MSTEVQLEHATPTTFFPTHRSRTYPRTSVPSPPRPYPTLQNKYSPSATSFSPTPNSFNAALTRRAIAAPNASASLSGGISPNLLVSARTYTATHQLHLISPRSKPRTQTIPASTPLHAAFNSANAASSNPPPTATAYGRAGSVACDGRASRRGRSATPCGTLVMRWMAVGG
jgi:hypothetical protein